MSLGRILYNNKWDSADFPVKLVNSEALPLSNTASDYLDKWRTVSTTVSSTAVTASILAYTIPTLSTSNIASATASTIVDTLALIGTNLSANATIRVRGWYSSSLPKFTTTGESPVLQIPSASVNAMANSGTVILLGGNDGRLARSTNSLTSVTSIAHLIPASAANTLGNVNTICYANSKFLIGGDSATLLSSTNGTSITHVPLASFSGSINIIIWSGTKYVAGFNNGLVGTSTDGITWTASTSIQTAWGGTSIALASISSLVYTGSIFVAGGPSGKIATSSDGITWTNVTGLSSTTWSTSGAVNSLAMVSTTIVAIGDSGKCATSTDGSTWTYRSTLSATTWGNANGAAMYYDSTNSRLIAIAAQATRIAYSSDAGATWTYVAAARTYLVIAVGLKCIIPLGTTFYIGTSDSRLISLNSSLTTALLVSDIEAPSNLYSAATVFDTGIISARPWADRAANLFGNTPNGLSPDKYLANTYARAIFANSIGINALAIEIVDTYSTTGTGRYIEASRIVLGTSWIPSITAAYGAKYQIEDNSIQGRLVSGDYTCDERHKKGTIEFTLDHLYTDSDYIEWMSLLNRAGSTVPIFVTLYPNNSDPDKERMFQIYGTLSPTFNTTVNSPVSFSVKLNINEA